MDPLSIVASTIAIVHLTSICLELGNEHLGSSCHTTTSLTSLIYELYYFFGAIQTLQTHLKLNEHDSARLSTLESLDGPLRDCNVALCLVEKRMRDDTFVKRKLFGKHFDKKLNDAMEVLRNGRGLFEIVLLADQRTITSAIERYTINVAEDIRDLKASLENSGELVRTLTWHATEAAAERHVELRTTLQEIKDKLSEARRNRKRSKRWAKWLAIAGQSAIQFAVQLALTKMLTYNYQHGR